VAAPRRSPICPHTGWAGGGHPTGQPSPDRERELRQHQQRHDGWLEANAHLGPQYRQVVRTLAWQRRATGLAVEQERAGYILEALGPVPASTRGRRAWRQAAAEIEQYRRTYQITDPDRASAPRRVTQVSEPTDSRPAPPSSGCTPSSAPTAAATPSRLGSPLSSRDLTSSVADEVPSGPPASTIRQEVSMASPQQFPFDDEDRPSGSVRPLSQADLQAILAHLSEDADQLLAGTGPDRPVVARRVQASVGRPGGSAHATWRWLRAAEWATWIRTLPWRVAATLAIGAGAGLVGSLLASRLGLVIGVLAATAAGWGLRFRPSPDAVTWRRGAGGERRTARLLNPLERQGWAVLHDLAVPGSRANLDHLVIGPGGVFVIDSKQYRGRLQLDPSGQLWHGRYPLAPTLRAASFEADQAAQVLPDPGVVVLPVVAVHGAQVSWGKVVTHGVPVVAARRLPSMLRQLPAVLEPERVAVLADQARVRFHAAA
jgi:hypothetical protein